MSHSISNFDQLVADALADIPEQFRTRVRNVAIVVSEEPTPEQCAECGIPEGETMYGYYEGTPLVERDTDGEPIMPDRVFIFRRPLEEDFGHDRDTLRREIAATIRHEIAHHFGIEDDRLEELGKY